MKTALIFSGILALTAANAFAESTGLPSEDTVVRMIRDRFSAAKETVPLSVLGKGPLQCKAYVALRGDFSRVGAEFKATEQFDGLWAGKVEYSHHSVELTFTMSPKHGLIAVADTFDRDEGHETVFYSREDEKNIYFEETQYAPRICNTSNAVPAVESDRDCTFAAEYLVCPKADQ